MQTSRKSCISLKKFHSQPGKHIPIRTVEMSDISFLWFLDSNFWYAVQKNKRSNISWLLNPQLRIQSIRHRVFKMAQWRFAIYSLHTTLTHLCRIVEGDGSLLLACTILTSMPCHLWVDFELHLFASAQHCTVATHVGCSTWSALQWNLSHLYSITSPQKFTIFYCRISVLKWKSEIPIAVRFMQLV